MLQMTTISKYLKHTVTKIITTHARGVESTVEVDDVKAYVTTYVTVEKDVSGSHLVERTLIFLGPDEVIAQKDKIRVNAGEVAVPIAKIRRPRFVGQPPNHIEVYLN